MTADAVSNDVLGMFEVLKRRDHDVRIFCESHALQRPRIYSSKQATGFLKSPDDVLIYHHSRGWDDGVAIVKESNSRRVIRYHNVTPAEFFAGFSTHEQEQCETGREQLIALAAARCDLYLSASSYSMQELKAAGADQSRSFVVPPFHQVERLRRIEPDKETLQRYADETANVVYVGRVAPHKNIHHLIEVFALYHHGYNSASRLFIVGRGGEGLSSYSKLLHRATEKLGLQKAVVFTGGVSDQVLRAYYLLADVFVTVSEHEGFCVPLVEAMAMNVPVTTYASAAIPETLGDAGIAWAERDPLLIAQSIDLLVRDSSVRNALAQRGLRRYEAMFSSEKIESSLLKALARLNE